MHKTNEVQVMVSVNGKLQGWTVCAPEQVEAERRRIERQGLTFAGTRPA